jgi:hypothetical protein
MGDINGKYCAVYLSVWQGWICVDEGDGYEDLDMAIDSRGIASVPFVLHYIYQYYIRECSILILEDLYNPYSFGN